jgi:hypothetical protein
MTTVRHELVSRSSLFVLRQTIFALSLLALRILYTTILITQKSGNTTTGVDSGLSVLAIPVLNIWQVFFYYFTG